jgi:cupin superfamily acireductone dioxygenase involved in methionine salvage
LTEVEVKATVSGVGRFTMEVEGETVDVESNGQDYVVVDGSRHNVALGVLADTFHIFINVSV